MPAFSPADSGPADYIIETRGLTKRFYGLAAISGVDLRARHGIVRIALQRPMGAPFHIWNPEPALRPGVTDLPYGRKRALHPRELLLDDPMAGLGHEDVDRRSDRITFLARGHNLAEGDCAVVPNVPRVKEADIGGEHD